MSNKLQELISAESHASKDAIENINNGKSTFKKMVHFDGLFKFFDFTDPDRENEIDTDTSLKYSVGENVSHAMRSVTRYIDLVISKEETNASGNANTELRFNYNGEEINFGKVSATALLALLKGVESIRDYLESVPTLDPSKDWIEDTDKPKGFWKTDKSWKYRKSKENVVTVLYPATDNHPAQVKESATDVVVGKTHTTYFSSRATVREKAETMSRLHEIILQLKKALSRANNVDVVHSKLGTKIFDWITSPII